MKKTSFFIIFFAAIVVLSAAFLMMNKKDDSQQSSPVSQTGQKSSPAEKQSEGSNNGTYVEYSESALANANGQRVLFFHAPWCPQCRSIEKGIVPGQIPSAYTIIKVDYDSNQELRKKYGVTLQTTFVKIDEQGNLIDKYVAYNEPTFDAVKMNYIK